MAVLGRLSRRLADFIAGLLCPNEEDCHHVVVPGWALVGWRFAGPLFVVIPACIFRKGPVRCNSGHSKGCHAPFGANPSHERCAKSLGRLLTQ